MSQALNRSLLCQRSKTLHVHITFNYIGHMREYSSKMWIRMQSINQSNWPLVYRNIVHFMKTMGHFVLIVNLKAKPLHNSLKDLWWLYKKFMLCLIIKTIIKLSSFTVDSPDVSKVFSWVLLRYLQRVDFFL